MPVSNKAVAVGLTAGLLLCGFLLGVAADRLYLSGKDSRRCKDQAKSRKRLTGKEKMERLTRRFRKRLELTDQQEKVVLDALLESNEEMKPIKLKIEPELRAVRLRAQEKIFKVLDPKQRKKYEEMVKRYERKRTRKFK